LASRLPNASVLYSGRQVDSVPTNLRADYGMSRILGREPGHGAELALESRRVARRARAATEFNFYGSR
jgi:glutamate-ammonia-ligase adenylyltransferase